MDDIFTCPVCGGDLEETGRDRCRCLYCGKQYLKKSVEDTADTLRRLLDEGKKEKADAARRNLYDAMHAEYVSNEECLGYAYILKGIIPEDYLANFAIVATSTNNDAALSSFLTNTSKGDMDTYATAVLDFMLRSLTSKTCAAVSAYIERAFSPTSEEYGRYMESYTAAARQVNAGVFDPSLRRGAFIAYSSKDLKKAVELCDYLESNGISCFLSSRNLTHGRGAVENYEKSLETAIDSCNTFVFISSGNSRSAGCEARSRELVYIMKKEQDEHKNVNYDYIPQDELKHRVEYLVESYNGSSPYDDQVRSFFHGLDWATTREDVARRIADNLSGIHTPRRAAPAEGEKRDITYYMRAASAGDAEAQCRLGNLYYTGEGVKKDVVEAFGWWRKAANKGNADAQNNLGACYADGTGVGRDFKEAVTWFESAAESGLASARYNLGVCYANGYGVPRDESEATECFASAAKKGHVKAMQNLGCRYLEGKGVERDLSLAVRWFSEAAAAGCAEAQLCLGKCYYYGWGLARDFSEAVIWFRKAAEGGNAEAQNFLGSCYRDGLGVDRDEAESTVWLKKAVEGGYVRLKRSK